MKEAEGAADAQQPDPRLVAVVERLFERCYAVRGKIDCVAFVKCVLAFASWAFRGLGRGWSAYLSTATQCVPVASILA